MILTDEQQSAIAKISLIPAGTGGNFLLHGITGSGKTEVYLSLTRKVVDGGGQVLVLVPEITLTPQLVARFQEAIGGSIVAYHSGLTEAQRAKVWNEGREGTVPIVIGTRSAVFLPLPKLQLIIVDEEHDASFKQEERFCYNARDLALWRGREEKATVVLGSATPSLETLQRVQEGKIISLTLTSRPGAAVLPTVRVIDRREKEAGSILSEELVEALHERLRHGEQSLLFLNRRGFAPFLLCPRCGFIPRCDGCEISLTYHKKEAQLLCHYCDTASPLLSSCTRCQTILTPSGTGTEKIEHDLKKLLPRARVGRLDRDTSRGKEGSKILAAFRKREIDILIGTQMVTKGHDFPALTLVGIIDADVALNLPDFRSAERSFQLLTQVAGRAGRADRPGEVIVQTFFPEHPSIAAAAQHDGLFFYERELKQRREAGYPPFVRLIQIRLSGLNRVRVIKTSQEMAHHLKRKLPSSLSKILGPAPCLIEKIRGKSRWHLLIKTPHYTRLQPHLKQALDHFIRERLPSSIKALVNVDPVDMI